MADPLSSPGGAVVKNPGPLPWQPLFVVTHLWFPGTWLFWTPVLLRSGPDCLQISSEERQGPQ